MLEVPEYIPIKHVATLVDYIFASGRCAYCHQPFREKPSAEAMADHTAKCVRKLESESEKYRNG